MAQSTSEREKIANFIHNVAEMEKRIYVLNAIKSNCVQKANKILSDSRKRIKTAENEKCKAETNVGFGNATTKMLKEKRSFSLNAFVKKTEESFMDIFRLIRFLYEEILGLFDFVSISALDGTFLGGCLTFLLFGCLGWLPKAFMLLILSSFLAFVFLVAPLLIISNFSAATSFLTIMCFLFPWIIATSIAFARRTMLENKERKRWIALSMSLDISADKKLENACNNLVLAKQEYSLAEMKSNFLLEQARICENASKKISGLLQKCYIETNIIKQDFRYIDCLMILDFAFRNDLVDTVREGIEYYETKVFHGQVIRGINNICSRLNELSAAVNGLRTELEYINENIDSLNKNSDEIISSFSTSVGLQKQILTTQNQALESTKATQYATESLRNSVVWHNNYYARY